jgi:hypothetical protein
MKTIQDINKEIIDTHKLLVETEKVKTKKGKRLFLKFNKQLIFLKHIKRYLETNPRPEFVQKQLEDVVFRIGHIDDQYLIWQAGRQLTTYKDPKKAYTNEMGLPILKEQLKTLKYILE